MSAPFTVINHITPAATVVVVPRVISVLSTPGGRQGVPGPPGASGDLNAVHQQAFALAVWQVTHNLGKRPSVTVVDSAGDAVEGSVRYLDDNRLTITFSAAFSGSAYLN